MDKKFESIVEKYNQIKKMGYIESVNDIYNGVGLTFEKLLGKDTDDFAYPDFDGVEIKTHRKYSEYCITLFGAALWGPNFPENERIRIQYGYYDYYEDDRKKINVEFYGNKNILICNRYFFHLEVNRKEERVYLVIQNFLGKEIERQAYWEFADLKDKLETKLKYLAVVLARDKKENGKTQYKYTDLYCYILKGFDTFLSLIENNVIQVAMTTSYAKFGPSVNKAKMSCYFRINFFDLIKLFDIDYCDVSSTERFI